MAVCIECTRNAVSTSHSWCHSWHTCHVKLLAHDLFTTVHRFVYFGCQWKACPQNCTCQIPVYCRINFLSLLIHPRCLLSGFIIFAYFFITKPLSRETVLYTNFIVYCQFLLQSLHPPLPFPVLWRCHSLFFFLSLCTSQPSGPISGKAISLSPRL